MNEPGFDAAKFLRVGVKGGGCSGMTYVLGFENKSEKDELFEIEGIPYFKPGSWYLFSWNGNKLGRWFKFERVYFYQSQCQQNLRLWFFICRVSAFVFT